MDFVVSTSTFTVFGARGSFNGLPNSYDGLPPANIATGSPMGSRATSG